MYKYPDTPKVLSILADIHSHIYNGTIHHEISQIIRHTKDQEIIETCQKVADCLALEIDLSFKKIDNKQLSRSLKRLTNHLVWSNKKFHEALSLKETSNSALTEAIFKETEIQLLLLSKYYMDLDKVPDITDNNGEVIRIGDLVAVECQDQKGREYYHFGVVISTPEGYRVAHFFTSSTIKVQNSIVEKGFGFIHAVPYSPEWIVQEHLSDDTPYSQVEQRINESRKIDKRIWSKGSYNCEHWAREMFSGKAECITNKRLLRTQAQAQA